MDPNDDNAYTITFQSGLYREKRLFSQSSSLPMLHQQACMFMDHFFPDHAFLSLQNNILLFIRGDGGDLDQLARVHSVEQLHNDCTIEILLSSAAEEALDKVSPHVLNVHSYKAPTFCDFCGQMLFGLVRQGLKCDMCSYNFHKRCAYKVPNNCSHGHSARKSLVKNHFSMPCVIPSSSGTHVAGNTDSYRSHRSYTTTAYDFEDLTSLLDPGKSKAGVSVTVMAGRPAWIDRAVAQASSSGQKVPHRFAVHSYKKPTVCGHCKKLLVGLFRQGLQCRDCKFNVHRACINSVEDSCSSEIFDEVMRSNSESSIAEPSVKQQVAEDSSDVPVLKTEDHQSSAAPNSSENNADSQNIPLQRIFTTVRKCIKSQESESLLAGWVIYYTSKNKGRQVRFWNVNTRNLRIYQTDRNRGGNMIENIPISSILGVSESKEAKKNGHYFEVEVDGFGTIYIGERIQTVEDSCIYQVRDSPPEELFARSSQATFAQALKVAISRRTAESWFNILKRAFRPVGDQVGVAISSENEEPTDISALYQVFPDEVLGSGQFGIVYAGVHRKKGHCIAIKVIDKNRFSSKHHAALRNEVLILQSIKHLGVVQLDHMFETADRVFIVMEKMDNDMLEMVLSSERGRLCERQTRFLIAQILYALQHLHSKQIAHCDLKPENVLLCRGAAVGFPQAKLCDFGFSRIIGESSFRKTIVGTPAYLAPEVLKNKGYNRSLDMWSVGVVIYVTLSGTFPFNEDEDIQDQIENADFLYPKAIWKDISPSAVDLINQLLEVDARRRLTAAKALNHCWLINRQLWDDLRLLERFVACRYMTHEAEDAYWQNQAQGEMPSRTQELPEEPVSENRG